MTKVGGVPVDECLNWKYKECSLYMCRRNPECIYKKYWREKQAREKAFALLKEIKKTCEACAQFLEARLSFIAPPIAKALKPFKKNLVKIEELLAKEV